MEHPVRYTNHFNGYITIEKGKEKVTLHANILGEVLRAYGIKISTQYEIHTSVMPDNNMSVSEEEYSRVGRLISLKGYFTRIPLKWGVIQEVTDRIYKGYVN